MAGGTSGHLIGGALAAVLLGPSAAVIVLCSVLVLQCFLFADGGITALGANLFNMAIVSVVMAGVVYRLVGRAFRGTFRGRLAATAFAAWVSTVAASVACAGELAFSKTVPWRVVFPAMVGVHTLIGLGEALITTLIVAAVVRLRPELWTDVPESSSWAAATDLVVGGLLTALGLAIFVAPFACGWPDGLEKVADAFGFDRAAVSGWIPAPWPDYTVPGVPSVVLSTAFAGVLGTLAAFGLAYGLARFLTPLEKK
ncbi:MAG: energy-coupling factor ABC transporter permease [Elusimicrobia bacterium]|nr:energy-coupling factor ABC transporter permease [Elusimicrobiota bacterium]